MRIATGILQVLDWAASFATPLTVLVMLGKFLERREGWLRLVLRYAAAWVMCNSLRNHSVPKEYQISVKSGQTRGSVL